MPTDHTGQLHAGSIGLFDDDDEYELTQSHLRRRQQRLERKVEKRLEKEARKSAKKSETEGSRPSGLLSWFVRLFGLRKASPSSRVVVRREITGLQRRSRTPLLYESNGPTYPASSVHPEPSIFLEECGMVRVRSSKVGGWDIVPRTAIRPG
ncbi:hypothetical protein K505DRAFT_227490 [Melanomma pulvis-pyrius CBS 109.77]|uniref:Uncharacterized protein n=1 Tax=Melanomma pulvis-pyrius CBS 109.77 TaxID=1314802 RepID=A0A6A6XWQ7_9PLEO|nr:hypothetical protein K505DRAFT_227490 [Melanomma pulvis-pyrius CBS 109.77]